MNLLIITLFLSISLLFQIRASKKQLDVIRFQQNQINNLKEQIESIRNAMTNMIQAITHQSKSLDHQRQHNLHITQWVSSLFSWLKGLSDVLYQATGIKAPAPKEVKQASDKLQRRKKLGLHVIEKGKVNETKNNSSSNAPDESKTHPTTTIN